MKLNRHVVCKLNLWHNFTQTCTRNDLEVYMLKLTFQGQKMILLALYVMLTIVSVTNLSWFVLESNQQLPLALDATKLIKINLNSLRSLLVRSAWRRVPEGEGSAIHIQLLMRVFFYFIGSYKLVPILLCLKCLPISEWLVPQAWDELCWPPY